MLKMMPGSASAVKLRTAKTDARRIVCDAMLLCSAVILSYTESFVPIFFFIPLPGIKLGLANIAVVIAAYDPGRSGTGIFDAAVISVLRICIMALMFGTAASFWFSLTGGAVSFIMLVLCRYILRMMPTAVVCAAGHNAGQILAAVLLFNNTSLFYFMPWSLLISVFTGLAVGALLDILSERLRTGRPKMPYNKLYS